LRDAPGSCFHVIIGLSSTYTGSRQREFGDQGMSTSTILATNSDDSYSIIVMIFLVLAVVGKEIPFTHGTDAGSKIRFTVRGFLGIVKNGS
jgi:hypothetical protein